MKKLKPLPRKIPKFGSYEEEANFWDTHDTSALMDDPRRRVRVTFARPVKDLISIRLDKSLLHALKVLAAKRHLPYQTLLQYLLAEKLREELKK